MAQMELERTKNKLESAETTRAQAVRDLERAKRTLQELTTKFNSVNESKELALKAAEAVKQKAELLEHAKSEKHLINDTQSQALIQARQEYMTAATQLDYAKQELNNIRQDFGAALEAKLAACQQAAEAQHSAELSSERVDELQKEIEAVKDTARQIKVASQEIEEELDNIVSERHELIRCYEDLKNQAEEKLVSLSKDYDPQLTISLEMKIAETAAEIEDVKKQLQDAQAAEVDILRIVTTELNEARRTLHKVTKEESFLKSLLNSLELELEKVKREYADEMKKMEMDPDNEKKSTIKQLVTETEAAKREAEEMKKNAEELKQEAEGTQMVEEVTEKKLQVALSELEEAIDDERKACAELNTKSDSTAEVKITKEEYQSLKKKAEEIKNLTEETLAEAMTHLEEINSSKSKADRQLEANLKAIEEINTAIEIALISGETAGTAQNMVEAELRRLESFN